MTQAVNRFNKTLPATQRLMYKDIQARLRRLDLDGDRIKPTIANLRIINGIKNRLRGIIINNKYRAEVKKFIGIFSEVSNLQAEYFKQIDKNFKPRSILGEIKNIAIQDTVAALGEAGIAANIGEQVANILRTNITTGGSYEQLTAQLKESLTDTETPGLLSKYAKQITNDAVNQYSAQYTQLVSGDLGFEWYAYQGSDIKTTRPFCDAMTDRRYFHVTEVAGLLKAEGLKYGNPPKQVPLYSRTGLPSGMIEGTTPENFFVRRGGYNCGHQIRPVSEQLVKTQAPDIYNRVSQTNAYKAWVAARKKNAR